MIKSFRHKELERFFTTGSTRGLDAQLAGKLGRLLSVLNTAQAAEDMRAPAHRLHQRRGARHGLQMQMQMQRDLWEVRKKTAKIKVKRRFSERASA